MLRFVIQLDHLKIHPLQYCDGHTKRHGHISHMIVSRNSRYDRGQHAKEISRILELHSVDLDVSTFANIDLLLYDAAELYHKFYNRHIALMPVLDRIEIPPMKAILCIYRTIFALL